MSRGLCLSQQFRNERIAFLLGAGASYDLSYPLVRDFLSETYYRWLFNEIDALAAPVSDVRLEYFLELAARYRTLSDNFEHVLSMQFAKDDDARSEVLEFVYRTIGKASALSSLSNMGSSAEFLALATMLIERNAAGAAAVVTFNYDTSVEEAISIVSSPLARTGKFPPERLFFTYCLDPPPYDALPAGLINFGSRLPLNYPCGGIPVLKLHGSVNLLHCEACGSAKYFPWQMLDAPPISDILGTECPRCDGALQRLIVPPSKRKAMPSNLAHVWDVAEFILRASDVVVIIGYSLPSYDVEARRLIAGTLQGKDVVFVDPKPNEDTIAFLTAIRGATVQVMRETATSFIQNEAKAYVARFAPFCITEAKCPDLRSERG